MLCKIDRVFRVKSFNICGSVNLLSTMRTSLMWLLVGQAVISNYGGKVESNSTAERLVGSSSR